MDTKDILEILRQIIDPEIGCNIVDLGLIYNLKIEESTVWITMTMTTPGCPMQEVITQGIQSLLGRLPEVGQVHIDLVWSPPWTPHMMNATAAEHIANSI